MKPNLSLTTLTTLTTLLACSLAQAHVTLDQPQASAGSAYKAVLRVGHGCSAGAATHTVSVRLPAGLRGFKPVPKAGWAITIRRQPLDTPHDNHGVSVTDEVAEITWQARTRDDWLADAHCGEFVLRGQLPAQPGPLWFKVQRACEGSSVDWAELPGTGTNTKGLKIPAALSEVLPATAAAHQH